MRLSALPLISGTVPALRPPQRAQVPLWLAVLLKKQKKANIIPPEWLSPESLERLVKWETENPERFTEELPWEWVEIGDVLCEVAEDDLGGGGSGAATAAAGAGEGVGGGGGDIRVLLRTLKEVRWSKAREGLEQLEST